MDNLIYLDNAATSFPKPKEVHDYIYSFCRSAGGSPDRSTYDLAHEAGEMVRNTRKMLCDLFNGTNPARVTFSYNASDSLNMIINGMLSHGDHVVTSCLEHNSVLRPLHHKTLDGLIDVTYVPFGSTGYIDPQDVRAAIRKNTRMIILNHVSNVIGTVQPLAEVGKICREANVYFAVDASQSAGIVHIDVQAMNIDLLAFTGHKSLLGPTGIGGSYVAENVPIRASRFGGTGVDSGSPTHNDDFPYRLECGTLNVFGVAGLHAGQKWLRENGTERLRMKELRLWERLRNGLQSIEKVTTYCADGVGDRTAVLSFNIAGWEAADVANILDADYGIACRSGLQCAPLVHRQLGTDKLSGTVRFSLGPYNTVENIDSAIVAIREIAETKRP